MGHTESRNAGESDRILRIVLQHSLEHQPRVLGGANALERLGQRDVGVDQVIAVPRPVRDFDPLLVPAHHFGLEPDQADEVLGRLVPAALGDRVLERHVELAHRRVRAELALFVLDAQLIEERLQAWLELNGCTPDDADAVVLAVNEAAANAIEHGYRNGEGRVEVAGDLLDHELRMSVVDHGDWRPGHPDPARGRGLPLMRTLMDDVDIEPLTPGTRVILRRRVDVGEDAPAMA